MGALVKTLVRTRAVPVALVLLLSWSVACSGAGAARTTLPVSPTFVSFPSDVQADSPSVTPADLAERLNPALERFRSDLQRYLLAYSAFVNLDITDMSWDAAVREIRRTSAALGKKLDVLEREQRELVPLVDAAIEQGAILELAAGEVSGADLRRYVELWGEWIKLGKQTSAVLDACLELPMEAALACEAEFYASADFQKSVAITVELNKLQVKLFGK